MTARAPSDPQPLESLVNPALVLERLNNGEPTLVCERPSTSGGVGGANGALVFSGYAASRDGIEGVCIRVRGRGDHAASIGEARPDVRLAFDDAPGMRRPGFSATLPTREWAPGVLDVEVTATSGSGAEETLAGRVTWWPSVTDVAEGVTDGQPAVWWALPEVDDARPAGDFLTLAGWVASVNGIERVTVEGPGISHDAVLIPLPHALRAGLPLPAACTVEGYRAVLDLRDTPVGHHHVEVVCTDGAGAVARRGRPLLVDPPALHRAWRRAHPGPPAPETHARMHLCVVGSGERDPSEHLASGQSLAPVRITATTANAGLGDALRGMLEDSHAHALVLTAEGDGLDPRTLALMGERFERDDPADLVYADEDRESPRFGREGPFLKPGWSPELALGMDYVGALVAVGRRAAAQAVEGWDRAPATARELVIRLVDAPLAVERIPELLSVRRAPAPAAPSEAGALTEVAARRRRRVEVHALPGAPTRSMVRWPLDHPPLVSVVVPTLGREEPLGACLRSLATTDYPSWEVVLVDSGDGGADEVAAAALADRPHRTVRYEGRGFNFSRAANLGAEAASGDLLLFLNDDTEAIEPGWMEALAEYATLPGVGAAGARLDYPTGQIQHAGLALHPPGDDDGWWPAQTYAFMDRESTGPHHLLEVAREQAAVVGACLMIPAALLAELGGWDEALRVDIGDIDLCLRVAEHGRRVVVVPWARLIHHESASRSLYPSRRDDLRFRDRWALKYRDGDALHHPRHFHSRAHELVFQAG